MKTMLRVLLMLALLASLPLFAAEEPASPPSGSVAEADTNAPATAELLRQYLELQGQLHQAQLAIERTRREAADAATRNAETIAARLSELEQTLTKQRETERQQLEANNQLMFLIGGGCVTLGFVAMLLTAYFQWRAVGRLTEFSMVSQASLSISRGALPPGAENAALALEKSNGKLHEVVARLEEKIRALEQSTHPALPESTVTMSETTSASTSATPAPKPPRVAVLAAKGQSLLDLDQPEEALAVFDEILTLDPDHADTLVKKGDTLERLGRADEAIACYDTAIAADAGLTIAYLHKGGLFNRMERHAEALKCYEEALRTQEKHRDG